MAKRLSRSRQVLQLVILAALSASATTLIWMTSRPTVTFHWENNEQTVAVFVNELPWGTSKGSATIRSAQGQTVRLESDGFDPIVHLVDPLRRFENQRVKCDWTKTGRQSLIDEANRLREQALLQQAEPRLRRTSMRSEAIRLLRESRFLNESSAATDTLAAVLRSQPTWSRPVLEMDKPIAWSIGDDRLRHSGAVRKILFTPDGARIVSGGEDGRIGLFDARTGNRIRYLDEHQSGITTLAISQNSPLLISGDYQGRVRRWNLDNLESTEIVRMKGSVTCAAFHPNLPQLAVGSGNHGLVVLNTKTQQVVRELAISCQPNVVAFSQDGNWLAVACRNGSVYLHSTREFERIDVFQTSRQIEHLYFSSDSRRMTAVGERISTTWNIRTGKTTLEHNTAPHVLGFAADGEWVSERRSNGKRFQVRFKFRDSESNHELGANRPNCVALHDTTAAIGTLGGAIFIRRLHTDEHLASPIPSFSNWQHVALDQEAERLALGTSSGRIEVIDIRNRRSVFSRKGTGEKIQRLFLASPSEQLIAFQSDELVLYSLDGNGVENYKATGPVDFSEDGYKLAYLRSATEEGSEIVIRDLQKKTSDLVKVAGEIRVTAIRIVPHWRLLLVGFQDGKVLAYGLRKGNRRWAIKATIPSPVNHIATRGSATNGSICVAHDNVIVTWRVKNFHQSDTRTIPGKVTAIRRMPLGDSIWYAANGSIWAHDAGKPSRMITPAGQSASFDSFELAIGAEYCVLAPGNATIHVVPLNEIPEQLSPPLP